MTRICKPNVPDRPLDLPGQGSAWLGSSSGLSGTFGLQLLAIPPLEVCGRMAGPPLPSLGGPVEPRVPAVFWQCSGGGFGFDSLGVAVFWQCAGHVLNGPPYGGWATSGPSCRFWYGRAGGGACPITRVPAREEMGVF